jgi:hypothetical protein
MAQWAASEVSDAGRLGFGMIGASALRNSTGVGAVRNCGRSSVGRGESYFVGVGVNATLEKSRRRIGQYVRRWKLRFIDLFE